SFFPFSEFRKSDLTPPLPEGIQNLNSRLRVIAVVAGNDGQPVDQCGRGDLLVQWMLGVRYAQLSPQLCDIHIESEYVFFVFLQDHVEPGFEPGGLCAVTPMSNQFDAASQLADGDYRKIKRIAVFGRSLEEAPDAPVG